MQAPAVLRPTSAAAQASSPAGALGGHPLHRARSAAIPLHTPTAMEYVSKAEQGFAVARAGSEGVSVYPGAFR